MWAGLGEGRGREDTISVVEVSKLCEGRNGWPVGIYPQMCAHMILESVDFIDMVWIRVDQGLEGEAEGTGESSGSSDSEPTFGPLASTEEESSSSPT